MFFDTHAHLDYPDFAPELPGVLERAAAAGIARVISIGTDLESSRRAVELSDKYPSVYATVGWHPSDAPRAPEDVTPELRELAKHPKVVAIGEIGLDYYRLPSKKSGAPTDDLLIKQKQRDIFRQQLELAAELGLNCVVHQRDSFEDALAMVRDFSRRVRTVFHCFSSGETELRRVLATGSIVSFTGIITYKNAENVRAALAAVPLGQFMLETDSPYLAPVPYRGKRCEPACVKEIAQKVSEVKGVSLEKLGEATCATAREFFPRLRLLR
jgi:TatD DNase family protein